MRHSAAIGIAAYVVFMGGVIGGSYAAFEAAIGHAPVRAASAEVVKQGPGFPASRKWTPVEIKHDVAELPPIPPYVIPSSEARARVAKNLQKRAVVVARRAAPAAEQRMASAYAPVEEPRSFFPFNFRF